MLLRIAVEVYKKKCSFYTRITLLYYIPNIVYWNFLKHIMNKRNTTKKEKPFLILQLFYSWIFVVGVPVIEVCFRLHL